MNCPDAAILARAAEAATAAAERDPANAAIHRAVAGLLTQWIHAVPHLRLGGFYPGLAWLPDLTRAYLDPVEGVKPPAGGVAVRDW